MVHGGGGVDGTFFGYGKMCGKWDRMGTVKEEVLSGIES